MLKSHLLAACLAVVAGVANADEAVTRTAQPGQPARREARSQLSQKLADLRARLAEDPRVKEAKAAVERAEKAVDEKIARDGADHVVLEVHRSLPPVLDRLRAQGYEIVGLEQTTGSTPLFTFDFAPRTVLVIGNERAGLEDDVLCRLDRVAEIPLAGLPHSLNAATSASIAIYEYCRQIPRRNDR